MFDAHRLDVRQGVAATVRRAFVAVKLQHLQFHRGQHLRYLGSGCIDEQAHCRDEGRQTGDDLSRRGGVYTARAGRIEYQAYGIGANGLLCRVGAYFHDIN